MAAQLSSPERPVFHIFPLSDAVASLYGEMKEGNENGDSGVDVKFPEDISVEAGETRKVQLGIRVWCECAGTSIPYQLIPRSSIGKTTLLAEEDYVPILGANVLPEQEFRPLGVAVMMKASNPQELAVTLTNHGSVVCNVTKGTALFQLVELGLREPKKVLSRTWEPAPEKQSPGLLPCSEQKCGATFLLLPTRAGVATKGATVLSDREWHIPARTTIDIGLGVKACCLMKSRGKEVPAAFMLLPFFERESKEKEVMPLVMKNWFGLIDKGYRGELRAKIFNESYSKFVIPSGIPLFGLLSTGALQDVVVVDEKDPHFLPGATSRGDGAFGSTGSGGKQ